VLTTSMASAMMCGQCYAGGRAGGVCCVDAVKPDKQHTAMRFFSTHTLGRVIFASEVLLSLSCQCLPALRSRTFTWHPVLDAAVPRIAAVRAGGGEVQVVGWETRPVTLLACIGSFRSLHVCNGHFAIALV